MERVSTDRGSGCSGAPATYSVGDERVELHVHVRDERLLRWDDPRGGGARQGGRGDRKRKYTDWVRAAQVAAGMVDEGRGWMFKRGKRGSQIWVKVKELKEVMRGE